MHVDLDDDAALIHIRNNPEPMDRHGADRLQPHGLPDPTRGRVPDPARFAHLLAARLRTGIGGVPDRDHDFLRAGWLERAGDVEAEAVIAAAMGASFPA